MKKLKILSHPAEASTFSQMCQTSLTNLSAVNESMTAKLTDCQIDFKGLQTDYLTHSTSHCYDAAFLD